MVQLSINYCELLHVKHFAAANSQHLWTNEHPGSPLIPYQLPGFQTRQKIYVFYALKDTNYVLSSPVNRSHQTLHCGILIIFLLGIDGDNM